MTGLSRRRFPRKREPGQITIDEACMILGITRRTFFRYRKEEPDFPKPVQEGRGQIPTLYAEADVRSWRDKRLSGRDE